MTTSLSPEEERARKREAIGLNPRRSTAQREIQLPPEERTTGNPGWLLVFLLLLVGAATVWMLYDTVSPTRGAASLAAMPRLILDDDFTRPQLDLGTGRVDGQWASSFANGAYRIQVEQPGNLTWSTLGLINVSTFRLETALTIGNGAMAATVAADEDAAPLGYGAILARYANERNFYLFSVDAYGAYQVQLQKHEIWQILQPWTPSPVIHRDGQINYLAVEDDGTHLRFYVNGDLLYTVTEPRLPGGDIALGGGTRSRGTVAAKFDWVKVFALPVATIDATP
ncbi:hypothetical protein GC175_01625 [bacterium]|nr:hypothetical protein [bacterium]